MKPFPLVSLEILTIVCIQWIYGGVSNTASSCTDCGAGNVTCVDGVCLPPCINETSSGECLQCRDSRFYGKQCQTLCPHTCLNSRCQLTNSRVVCTEGCVDGKKGDNCDVNCLIGCIRCQRYDDICTGPCREGYYGKHCQFSCSSTCEGECEIEYGTCIRCKFGYMGSYCDEKCPPNCTALHRPGCAPCTHVRATSEGRCSQQCPANCSVCGRSTVSDVTEETSTASTTMPTPSGSKETLKIVIAVLGTLLCTAVVIFLYKKLTKHKSRKIGEGKYHRRNQATSGYSPEYRTSSLYTTSKYWEILEKDLDASVEDRLVIADQDGSVHDRGCHQAPEEAGPLPDLQAMDYDDLSDDEHSDNQDSRLRVFKVDESQRYRNHTNIVKADVLWCDSKKRSRSWGCERNEPKATPNVQRPQSDSVTCDKACPRETANDLFMEDPVTRYKRTVDVSNIKAQYITPKVVDPN